MADYEDAPYAVDERKSGWVRVIMGINGLQVKRESWLSSKKMAKNAHIPEPDFRRRTVLVKVERIQGKNFQLRINKLPYDIDGDSSYIEPDEDRVFVFLKKADSSQSWKPYIEGNGIETADS